ncbi:MAG TPA: ParB N-terminal domain-containing protein [bacterium]|jgi:hypothetical protein
MAPASAVQLHEEADPARIERLSSRLRDEGVLRNPALVAVLPDGDYVVLDGANRTSALIMLGAAVIPVQVVDYSDPGVALDVWSHFLLNAGGLPSRLQAKGFSIRALPQTAELVPERGVRTCFVATGNDIYEVDLGPQPAGALAGIVGTYKGTTRIYRVPGLDPGEGIHEQLHRLAREYGADGTLIDFPMLTKADILTIARDPVKLPTGITRHLIAGRALRLNVPLEVLTAPGAVDEKQAWLAEYVQQKLLDNRVRYYPEATVLFDE